jgi:hypothetical protein
MATARRAYPQRKRDAFGRQGLVRSRLFANQVHAARFARPDRPLARIFRGEQFGCALLDDCARLAVSLCVAEAGFLGDYCSGLLAL